MSKSIKMCQNVWLHIDLRGDLLVNEVVNYLRSKYE